MNAKIFLTIVSATLLLGAARADLAKELDRREEAERTLSNDKLDAAKHLQAVEILVGGDVEKGHFALADARYDTFLKDHPLDLKAPHPYASAWIGKARLKWLQHDKPGAIAVIERAIAGLPKDKKADWTYGQVLPRFQSALFDYLPRDKAFDYYVAKGWRVSALNLCTSIFRADDRIAGGEKAKALARTMLTEKTSPFGDRIAGWLYLFARDPAFADAHEPLRPTDNAGCTNAVVRNLRWDMERQYLIRYNTANVLRAWKMMKRCLDATKGAPEFCSAESALKAYADAGDRAGFAETAAYVLTLKKLSDAARYEVALAVELMKMKGTEDEIAAAISKVEPTLAGQLPAKQRLQHYCRAGQMAQRLLDENLTRAVAKYREKVHVEAPKKTYVVKYSETPITGISDFARLAFKPEVAAFDRPFGGETTAMFESDVATGNRGNATKGGDGTTALAIVADVWGIHFLRTYRDKRARDFELGFLDPGTFEEYIAPGADQPYTCLLFAPKKGAIANFYPTSYDGMGYRRLEATNPASFRSDVAYTDEAILTYTAISWDNYPTLVPANGATWDFESCYWGPKTCAWNGLKTVHGRSTWGLLKFELSEKARLAIVKNLVCQAAARYRHERDQYKKSEGVLYFWQDPVVGDKAFYDAKLVPFAAELDAVVKRVKPDMTDDDVKDIAENHLQKLAFFRLYVERLRIDWLEEHGD